MRTVLLGTTGVDVSILCLGAMRLGSREDEPTSVRLLDRYVEAGGSFIDTANIYAHWVPGGKGGDSETLLGRWMRERNNRDSLFIASKLGFEYPGVQRGLRAAQIEAELDKSLQRLGMDTIDLYYAHVDDRYTPMEETLQAFDRAQRAGKVRFIGASNFLAWRLEEAHWVSQAHAWPEYVCIQQRYTYLQLKPGATFSPQLVVNDDLLDYCRVRGVTVLAYSPLLSGAYTRADRSLPSQYAGPDSDARLMALTSIAAECGITVNQVVLAWMMHSNPIVIPVFAVSTDQQMRENLQALDVHLSTEQMARLNAAAG